MAFLALRARTKRKFRIMTTDSNHHNPIAPRVFKVGESDIPSAPNQVWAGDITYIRMKDKFLYFSTVIDIFNREVVGWSLDKTLNSRGVLKAISNAYKNKGNPKGVIFHSDRGVQYSSEEYRKFLASKKAIPSMSRRGNCYDNSFVESFFKTLKIELIYGLNIESEEHLRSELFYYIESWYNRKRIHSSLDYLSPVEYERKTKVA